MEIILLQFEPASTIHRYIRDNINLARLLESYVAERNYGSISHGCQFRTIFISKLGKGGRFDIWKCTTSNIPGVRWCEDHSSLQGIFHDLYKLFESVDKNLDAAFLRIFHSLIFFSGAMDRGHRHYTEDLIKYDLTKAQFAELANLKNRRSLIMRNFDEITNDISSFVLSSFLSKRNYDNTYMMKVGFDFEKVLRNDEEDYISEFYRIEKSYQIKLNILLQQYDSKSMFPLASLFRFCKLLKRS